VIDKVGRQLAASFPVDLFARQASEALALAPDCAELKVRILSAEMQPEAFWAEIDPPQVPTLDGVRVMCGHSLPGRPLRMTSRCPRGRDC
jgi:hypothetical protein